MRKILIASGLASLFKERNAFQDRSDIQVFTASTNDDVLSIHRAEKTDLIITQLEHPGQLSAEDLFYTIRSNDDLRDVSTILICRDTLAHRERCKRCCANAVFTMPVDTALLELKVQQFLNVAPRKSYRAVLAVAIEGRFKNRPQPFWTENISTSGMLIRTREPLSKGAGTFFSFFLPNGTHVSGYGEIMRIVQPENEPDSFLYGIKFTDIEPGTKTEIEAVVNG